MRRRLAYLLATACAAARSSALPSPWAATVGSWAAPQIKAVTKAGVLGKSPATFAPQSPLTQAQLAQAIAATNTLQAVPATPPAASAAAPLALVSSIAPDATVGGPLQWTIDSPGRTVARVAFAVDGTGIAEITPRRSPRRSTRARSRTGPISSRSTSTSPAAARRSPPGRHRRERAGLAALASTGLVAVPIAKSSLPPVPTPTVQPAPDARALPRDEPVEPVTMKQLDAALVAYLDLGGAAHEIQTTLAKAGLEPPPDTGTEAVARLLGLRLNHPANEDALELLPTQPATRAEAAYSFAQVLARVGAVQSVQQAADSFTLPTFTPWQQRLLTTAIAYVGYPYVWGGTSPTAESFDGVQSVGGFDCSGFVWRVVKLTPYPGEGRLASVLRGRTTYVMSGEVPRRDRITAANLQPADVMFFGANGPKSSPSVVDHTALYLGNGWFVQSSDEGVTLLPFSGWYTHSFAWGRTAAPRGRASRAKAGLESERGRAEVRRSSPGSSETAGCRTWAGRSTR